MIKRILFVSLTGTLDNGAEKSITNLMIYLSENGYQIFNVYPENGHYTHRQYVQSLLKRTLSYFHYRQLNGGGRSSRRFTFLKRREKLVLPI